MSNLAELLAPSRFRIFFRLAQFLLTALAAVQISYGQLNVMVNLSAPSPQPVGEAIFLTAGVSNDTNTTLRYRFMVEPPGATAFNMLADYREPNDIQWSALQEGTYQIQVSVMDTMTGQTGQTVTPFQFSSRIVGNQPAVSPSAHPLVAIYSAPPCSAGTVQVVYWPANGATLYSNILNCQANLSANFFLGGMRALTSYTMRHKIVNNGTTTWGPALTFTTASVPVTLPAASIPVPAAAGTSTTENMILQSFIGLKPGEGFGGVAYPPVAYTLFGAVTWYYPIARANGTYLTRPVAGGTFLVYIWNGTIDETLVREIDLQGDVVRESNAYTISQQLAAMQLPTINWMSHEAMRLPNGHTLVLGMTERILTNVQGPGAVDVVGDMIVDLDQNFQVTWTWNTFDHLPNGRTAILGEICVAGVAPCGQLYLAPQANDWTHCNSLHLLPDGNLVLSIRNQDWIVKIDYQNGAGTGQILWTLGNLAAQNNTPYFTLSNGSGTWPWFSHQHDVEFDGNNYEMLDNGNTRVAPPPLGVGSGDSRGQVYSLNETTLVATQLLSVDLGRYSPGFGSAQLLANNDYWFLLGALATNGTTALDISQELTPSIPSTDTYDISFPSSAYRAFRLSSLYGPTQLSQTITFAALANQPFGTSPSLSATATSGLPVSFGSQTPAVCTVSGSSVTLVSVGQCTIQATQPGNVNYIAATPVNQSFQVIQGSQVITFNSLPNLPFGAAPFMVSATVSSGLAVSFSATTPSVCTVTATTVTLVSIGQCTIQATQNGNADWLPATPVNQSFQITQGSQSITFNSLPNQVFGAPPFAVNATASSGLTVSFASNTSVVCAVSGSTVTVLAAGQCTIQASQNGNSNWLPATPVSQSFQVAQASQTITFGPLSNQVFGTPPFSVGATATSGLPVNFNSQTPGDCSVSAGLVTLLGLGRCTIRATQSGNANWLPATPVNQSFQVTQATTTTSLSVAPDPSVFGSLVALTATVSPASATGNVTFYDGVLFLGVAPVSNGVATFNTTLLASGPRSLSALYTGSGSLPGASSLSSFTETVNAQVADGFTAANGSPFPSGSNPHSVAVSDFNGDGIPDLAAANKGDNTVSIFLGSGSGAFTASSASPVAVGTSPVSVAVSDFNGDGIPDLAVVNLGDNTVSVMLGNGSGGFTPAPNSPFAVGNAPYYVAVADFNNDGNADLAVSNATDGTVTILLGNGAGGFTAASGSPYAVGSAPYAVAVADFNGDGNADMAVANANSNNVTVLLGDGSGGFNAALGSPFAVGNCPYSLAVADFNHDGNPDLAVANYTDSTVTVLLGKGSGGFTPANGSPFAAGNNPLSVAVGDFNGDGYPDLVFADTGSSSVTVLYGSGSGTFPSSNVIALAAGAQPDSIAVSNFNGDGRTDLAVANNGNNNISILLGVDSPTQLQVTQQPSSGTAGSLVGSLVLQVEDAAGNLMTGSAATVTVSSSPTGVSGTLTVNAVGGIATFSTLAFNAANSYTLTASAPGLASATTATIQINFATQTITFGPLANQTLGVPPFPVSATASSGLAVGFASTTPGICTVSGSTVTLLEAGVCTIQATQAGNATYAAATPVNQSFQVTLPATSTALSASPNPAVLGSPVTLKATINPSPATGTVTFYDGVSILGIAPVSSGLATFSTSLLTSGSRSLTARYVGGGSQPGASSLSPVFTETVKAQVADGFLAAPGTPFAAGLTPTALVLSDFNGDGIPDLAVALGTGGVAVFLGNGSGGFAAPNGSPFATGNGPQAVVSADFNGDGYPDLAVANSMDNTVTVLLGNGSGGFTAASGSPFAVGTNPSSMAVADFNANGNADLVVANQGDNTVTVLLGNGSGGFTPAPGSPFAVGASPQSVAVADFNRDGNADLAVLNNGGNTVTVLLGNGSAGFTAAGGSPFAAGTLPAAVTVGDFNGDGKPDLAIADGIGGSGTVTVLLGNGSGGFSAAGGSPFPVGFNPSAIAVGDFNGDGKTDLAVANQGNLDVSILLGNGSGGFTVTAASPAVGTQPVSIAVGDFNGDGKTDLAVANQGSNNITILLGSDVATQLHITQAPSNGTAGVPVAKLVVQLEDAAGNLISGSTAVTVSSSPAGIAGTLTANAVNGVATFTNLLFIAANKYTVTASASGLASASTTVTVVASPPGTPSVVSVSPNPANGLSPTFALTYADTGGNASLNRVAVNFGPTVSASNSCWVSYNPGANLLTLLNDAGSGSTQLTLGSGTVSNSQCSVNGTASSVSRSGATLTLNLALTASSTYTGKQSIFMYAADISAGNTGWVNEGVWTPAPNQPPRVVSVTPNPASGLSTTLALTYSDPNGASDLDLVKVVLGSAVTASNTCYVVYHPASNLLYLLNNAGVATSSITPGSGTLLNSQCTIVGSGTSVQRSGDTLTLNLAITASSTYTAKQNVYMYAEDNSSAVANWVKEGTWIP